MKIEFLSFLELKNNEFSVENGETIELSVEVRGLQSGQNDPAEG